MRLPAAASNTIRLLFDKVLAYSTTRNAREGNVLSNVTGPIDHLPCIFVPVRWHLRLGRSILLHLQHIHLASFSSLEEKENQEITSVNGESNLISNIHGFAVDFTSILTSSTARRGSKGVACSFTTWMREGDEPYLTSMHENQSF